MSPWTAKENCSTLQQGTEQSIFRVIFRNRFDMITTMILQNNISLPAYFELQVLIAEHVRVKSQKKSVEPHSREQSRAYSKLSFKLGSILSLQWSYTIAFSELAHLILKVLIAEHVLNGDLSWTFVISHWRRMTCEAIKIFTVPATRIYWDGKEK